MNANDPTTLNSFAPNPLNALRRFVGRAPPPSPAERCELCNTRVATEHSHLVEPSTRRILCSCDACALLFADRDDARFRRVPRDTRILDDFTLTDAQWDSLRLPINLAFFSYSTPAARMIALYPSPAGAVESLLTMDAWAAIPAANPLLASMQPDTEALLVNRLGPTRGFTTPEYYLAPIDRCYELVGIVRGHWRGLSGGPDVWREIGGFFAQCRAETNLGRKVTHA